MTIVHLFDPETRRPVGPHECQTDPKTGKDLRPRHCLDVAPPKDLWALAVVKAGASEWFIDHEATRAAALAEVAAFGQRIRIGFTGSATPEELAAWPNKAERARRFIAGTASDADNAALNAEAQARGLGESAAALAKLQLEKEAQYAAAVALIDGLTRKARGAIEDAPNEQIEAIMAELQSEADAALQSLQQKG